LSPAANDNAGKQRDVAEVDMLVDENGSPIEVPPDSELKVAGENDATVGATGPTNWWRLGLLALAVVLIILGVLQVLNGGDSSDALTPPATTTEAPPAQ
jgi:hypothetical protein